MSVMDINKTDLKSHKKLGYRWQTARHV